MVSCFWQLLKSDTVQYIGLIWVEQTLICNDGMYTWLVATNEWTYCCCDWIIGEARQQQLNELLVNPACSISLHNKIMMFGLIRVTDATTSTTSKNQTWLPLRHLFWSLSFGYPWVVQQNALALVGFMFAYWREVAQILRRSNGCGWCWIVIHHAWFWCKNFCVVVSNSKLSGKHFSCLSHACALDQPVSCSVRTMSYFQLHPFICNVYVY